MTQRRTFVRNDVLYLVYKLAEQIGEWDIQKMLEGMTTRQLIDWMAYWKYKDALFQQSAAKEAMKHGTDK